MLGQFSGGSPLRRLLQFSVLSDPIVRFFIALQQIVKQLIVYRNFFSPAPNIFRLAVNDHLRKIVYTLTAVIIWTNRSNNSSRTAS